MKESTPSRETRENSYWWNAEDRERGECWRKFVPRHDQVRHMNMGQHILDDRHWRFYEGMGAAGTDGMFARINSPLASRLSFNVCRSCVDTFSSQQVQSAPIPMCLTTGGTYEEQERAKRMNRFLDAALPAAGAPEIREENIDDAGIWGHGIAKLCIEDGKPKIVRVLPSLLDVDPNEVRFGKSPRNFFECVPCDRLQAIATWPEFADEITRAPKAPNAMMGADYEGDMIMLREGFHLRSKPRDPDLEDDEDDEHDGWHIICIDGADLLVEPYGEPDEPYAYARRKKAKLGWRPTSIVEELVEIQREIMNTVRAIADALALAGKMFWTAETGTINEADINEVMGKIIYNERGTREPRGYPGIPVNQSLFDWYRELKTDAYQLVGISEMGAKAEKPAGLDSAVALNTFDDKTSARFSMADRNDERYVLRVAQLYIRTCRQIVREGGKVVIQSEHRGDIEDLDFADIMEDEKNLQVRIFPINGLSKDPAERLAEVIRRVQAGFMSAEDGMRLTSFPDLQAFEDHTSPNASNRRMRQIASKIIDHGKYIAPSPLLNLQASIDYFQACALDAECNDVDESRITMLHTWIAQAQDLLKVPTAPVPPAPAMAGPPPPGGPPAPVPLAPPPIPTPQAPQQAA